MSCVQIHPWKTNEITFARDPLWWLQMEVTCSSYCPCTAAVLRTQKNLRNIWANTPQIPHLRNVDSQPLFLTLYVRAKNLSKHPCHLGPSDPNGGKNDWICQNGREHEENETMRKVSCNVGGCGNLFCGHWQRSKEIKDQFLIEYFSNFTECSNVWNKSTNAPRLLKLQNLIGTKIRMFVASDDSNYLDPLK